MGQPSPTTGFALAITLELGGCLLRLPGIRMGITRSVRAIGLALAAAIFRIAADNGGQAARVFMTMQPPYCLPQPALPAPFIPLRPSCRQDNVQHPPRRAS